LEDLAVEGRKREACDGYEDVEELLRISMVGLDTAMSVESSLELVQSF
jgi:hypothetical protein